MAKKYNFKSLYKDYMNQYNKSMGKAGTAAEPPQSFNEFKMNFNSVKVSIKENKLHRLSGKQIAEKMAREDVYEKSSKQAKMIKQALIKKGFKAPSLSAIRAGQVPGEFWNLVREERKAAISRGLSTADANIYISQYIFGSP